eukprot:359469-Chlamydomonas_euryale.AAC.19
MPLRNWSRASVVPMPLSNAATMTPRRPRRPRRPLGPVARRQDVAALRAHRTLRLRGRQAVAAAQQRLLLLRSARQTVETRRSKRGCRLPSRPPPHSTALLRPLLEHKDCRKGGPSTCLIDCVETLLTVHTRTRVRVRQATRVALRLASRAEREQRFTKGRRNTRAASSTAAGAQVRSGCNVREAEAQAAPPAALCSSSCRQARLPRRPVRAVPSVRLSLAHVVATHTGRSTELQQQQQRRRNQRADTGPNNAAV